MTSHSKVPQCHRNDPFPGKRFHVCWWNHVKSQLISCQWQENLKGKPGGCREFDAYIYRSYLPSGKRVHNYGKPQFFMGKSTINGHFNSYVKLPEGNISGLFDDSPFPSIHTSHLPVLDSKEQEFSVRLSLTLICVGMGSWWALPRAPHTDDRKGSWPKTSPTFLYPQDYSFMQPVSRQAAFADGFLNMHFKVPTAGRQARPQTRPRAVHRKERLHHTPSPGVVLLGWCPWQILAGTERRSAVWEKPFTDLGWSANTYNGSS